MDDFRFKLTPDEQKKEDLLYKTYNKFVDMFYEDAFISDDIIHLFRNPSATKFVVYHLKIQPIKKVDNKYVDDGEFFSFTGDWEDMVFQMSSFMKVKRWNPNKTIKQIHAESVVLGEKDFNDNIEKYKLF